LHKPRLTLTVTPASVVIPTRQRPRYLEVALASICPQARAVGAEVLVVDDAGPSAAMRAEVERFGARYEPLPRSVSLNAARNVGVERSGGELVVFVDDDIRACAGWLAALIDGAHRYPDIDVFTGPLRARLEGPAPRSCGRERPPITSLELGQEDRDCDYAWGANMTIRRAALARVGCFDVSLEEGDEQEWQERMRRRAPGARVRYLGGAAVEHRRVGADARLRALSRSAWTHGRASRRFDVRSGRAPSLTTELKTLTGCLGHVLRHRCPAGLTMVARSSGRVREALGRGAGRAHAHRTEHEPTHDDFLSGQSGTVGGLDALRRGATDEAVDALEFLSGRRRRLRRAARTSPPTRDVLALSVVRAANGASAAAIRDELARSRHRVELHTTAPGERGKFENLNILLAEHPPTGHDWLLVLDDDVALPRDFLDRFLFLCERFSLALAQPAHRLHSHAAWPVTRRRAGSVVRETGFVEIGPVTAFAHGTFDVLLPFPPLRMGWGLDVHWAALARQHGWRCGIVDAVPISHLAAPAAASYAREEAVAEARTFLAEHPYLRADEAGRTLATHRRW